MSEILVTGCTGFVGRNLSNLIGDARYVVRNSKVGYYKDTFSIEGLNTKTDWYGAFKGIRTVIHLAGLAHCKSVGADDFDMVNTQGTLHLAKESALNGVKRFVFVSSIGVNGLLSISKPFCYKTIPQPHNSYARSKLNAEIGLRKISEETGLEVVIVRPTLVYGPSAPGNFGTLTKLVHKVTFLPFGMASNRRDFIAVQNLADLLVTCANHPDAAGHTFLASDGETVSIKEFTNAIAEGLGKKVIQLPVPVSVMRLAGKLTGKSAMIEQLYGNLEVDSSNIKEVLDWTPPLTMKQAMATLRDSGVK
ncbi:NAD-dependent epimerase/dehydratase family protein [Vibrio alfacsensis]|uniref:NAD-dependent epimerase/dehydratase family protein n=1 Tax=Vibrio alfacsensis TaxID=1074311 RepID=UPI001BEDE1F6|nr:NAD-dependent epimerase/dehydratase family protein [Vibrio alfacsensis]BCN23025.1 epimerase [Vibrio alfacsensis]